MYEGLGWNGGGWGFILSPASPEVLVLRWKEEGQDQEKPVGEVEARHPYTLQIGDRVLIKQGKRGRMKFCLISHRGVPSIYYSRTWGPKPNRIVRLSRLPLEAFANCGVDPHWR